MAVIRSFRYRYPTVLSTKGEQEFSVNWSATLRRFVAIQVSGGSVFGKWLGVPEAAVTVSVRTAANVAGPWSTEQVAYTIPRPDPLDGYPSYSPFAYTARAHPEQNGADWVVTYNVNDNGRFPPDRSSYYPMVLKLSLTP